MRAPLPLLVLALALAGCALPAGHTHGAIDTGDIAPGAEKSLTYDHVGTFDMHCHPHPAMKHVVTVTDDPPAPAHVHIFDGDAPGEFRFEPAELTVGKGSVVTYHNHGRLTHTVTLS